MCLTTLKEIMIGIKNIKDPISGFELGERPIGSTIERNMKQISDPFIFSLMDVM